VTKHGSLSTIQKQEDKVRNGTHLHHHFRKKREGASQKSNPCSSAFLTVKGLSIQNLCLKDKLLNQFYLREILERPRKRVVYVRPSIANNWMLHYDNAPCRMAISVIECLAKKEIPVVPQPPYSPDLSPCDFFLLTKLKFYLKGRHFWKVENIKKAVTDKLKAIPVSDFQRCYEEWEQRPRRYVASQGNYFEGDKIDL